MTWCIDFDGTIVTHEFPKIGSPVPRAIEGLRLLRSKEVELVLFTMRSGKYLDEAVKYLNSSGIQLRGINVNPTQNSWTTSPKAYGNVYVDDASFGCPLIYPDSGRPYVNWTPIIDYIKRTL